MASQHWSQKRKLNEEQEIELLADYKAGALSWKDMGIKYGIHPHTISIYLDRFGIERSRAVDMPAIQQGLITKERNRRAAALARENRKFRAYVLLLLRRQSALEEQVRALGGTPCTTDTWRVGQPRTKGD